MRPEYTGPLNTGNPTKTAAETRLEHGTQGVRYNHLDLRMCDDIPPCIQINRAAPLDLTISILPTEGCYTGGKIDFLCRINLDYPLSAPKVKCLQRVHPSILLIAYAIDFPSEYRDDWCGLLEHSSLGLETGVGS
jgi:hypothetical protein